MNSSTKNLPVLYTIPIWRLLIKLNNKTYYYIPELNKYVFSKIIKNHLSLVGKTTQDYYDRWVLNITTPSQRPRCNNPKCNKILRFNRISVGYGMYCNNSCNKSYNMIGNSNTLGHKLSDDHKLKIREGVRKSFNDNNTSSKMSISQIKRFKNPKERQKLSESSRIRFSNLDERLKISNKMRYIVDNTNFREKVRLSIIKRYKDDKSLSKRLSDSIKNHYINNPQSRIRQSISHIKLWMNPSESLLKTLNNGNIGIHSKIYSKYEFKFITFDSNLERKFYLSMSSRSDIVSIYREPTHFMYYDSQKNLYRNYYPDFLIVYSDGVEELIEIKPFSKIIDQNVIDKSIYSVNFCYLLGLKYSIYTDLFINKSDSSGIIKLI